MSRLGLGNGVVPARAAGPASERTLAPPAVSPDVYDEDYFLEVCAGSTEWRRSGGAESAGVYQGLARLAGIAPGETLVDIGTGRGELLVAALDAGAARAVGVEYSEAAVDLARRTLAASGVGDRAEVLLCDARAAPLPESSADVVTFCDVVEHLTPDELAAAFAEARRLLRPGGRAFVHTFPTRTIYDVTYRSLRLLLGRWRRWPRDPRNEYERVMHVNEQTRLSLRRALRSAGFTSVDVRLGDAVYVEFLPSERVKQLYRRLATHRLTRPLAVANLFATARKPEEA
jgi:ubiquinone/menaquinone biosynthesis C-methylase UbiE